MIRKISKPGPLTRLREANERATSAAIEQAIAPDAARLRASLQPAEDRSRDEFLAKIRQSGSLARAAGIHRTACPLAAGSEAAAAWLDGWQGRDATLALLQHLRVRYPRHDFGTASKESLSVEEEEAPDLLIVWTHQGMCCFDPRSTDAGFGHCDPKATYGIAARDADRIRKHNVATLV